MPRSTSAPAPKAGRPRSRSPCAPDRLHPPTVGFAFPIHDLATRGYPHVSSEYPIVPGHPRQGPARRRSRSRFVPGLLGLEARALLSTLFVTNDNDSGTGSLRYELGAASAGDTIKFAPKADGTITLTSGPLVVATSVDIQGPGADRVTVSGGGTSEVFDVEGGVTATISGLTVADGSDTVANTSGAGGIFNQGR